MWRVTRVKERGRSVIEAIIFLFCPAACVVVGNLDRVLVAEGIWLLRKHKSIVRLRGFILNSLKVPLRYLQQIV